MLDRDAFLQFLSILGIFVGFLTSLYFGKKAAQNPDSRYALVVRFSVNLARLVGLYTALARISIRWSALSVSRYFLLSLLRRYPASGVPKTALFLLYVFLGKAERAAIPGDLVEEFNTCIVPQFGIGRARLWFWARTFAAIGYRNLFCRWLLVGGGLLKLGEWVRRAIGS